MGFLRRGLASNGEVEPGPEGRSWHDGFVGDGSAVAGAAGDAHPGLGCRARGAPEVRGRYVRCRCGVEAAIASALVGLLGFPSLSLFTLLPLYKLHLKILSSYAPIFVPYAPLMAEIARAI